MKKIALLLAGLLVLLALPAQAAMMVNDHFDGSSLDPAWNISKSNPYSVKYGYSVHNSNLRMDYMQTTSASTPYIKFSQQFDPIDDFEAEFKLSWGSVHTPRYGLFGLRLFDSDNDLVSGLYYYDVEWDLGQDYLRASYDGESYTSYGDMPRYGSGIGSMVRQDGILSFYWDDVLLTSTELLNQVAKLELFFQYPTWKGSPNYNLTTFSVDYVTLENDPVDPSATPEPGTMMLLGSALGLGAWWQRRRKRNKNIQA